MSKYMVKYLGKGYQMVEVNAQGQVIVCENNAERVLPTDILALALADCAEMVLGMALEKKGLDFSGSYIEVSKEADFEEFRVKEIRLVFHLRQEYDEATRAEIPRILEDMCVVGRSLHPTVRKNYTFCFDVA
ncbi:hypothetical protein TAMA11512_24500 [Selenomonas sp. TAMA-11512]|uniref:OsmC family protein n=1 Tax=Selenomonas sp. TAMA-11512 TaxID=3095337 RepID=UPI00308578D2|nr:hypothetical protein TAMA11512_24500 [Selenomonas sp. TAMA-11512]